MDPFSVRFSGLYNGAGDHFEHDTMGGYDLHINEGENQEVAWNNTDYSTTIFANRAAQLIEEHDQSKVPHY